MPGTGKTTAKEDRDAWHEANREMQDMMNLWRRPNADTTGIDSVDTHRVYRRVGSKKHGGQEPPAKSHRRTQQRSAVQQERRLLRKDSR